MVFPCLMQKWHVLMTSTFFGKVFDFIFLVGIWSWTLFRHSKKICIGLSCGTVSRILGELCRDSPLGKPKCQCHAVRSQNNKLDFEAQFSYTVPGISGEELVFLRLPCSVMPSITKDLWGVKPTLFSVWRFVKLWHASHYNYVGLVPKVDALYSKRGPPVCSQEYWRPWSVSVWMVLA